MEKQFIKDAEMVFYVCKNRGLYMSARVKTPTLDMNHSFMHQCSMNADYHSMTFPGEKGHPDTQVSSVPKASTYLFPSEPEKDGELQRGSIKCTQNY